MAAFNTDLFSPHFAIPRTAKIGFFGVAGDGKSSLIRSLRGLCNEPFELPPFPRSSRWGDASDSTTTLQVFEYRVNESVVLVDLPGRPASDIKPIIVAGQIDRNFRFELERIILGAVSHQSLVSYDRGLLSRWLDKGLHGFDWMRRYSIGCLVLTFPLDGTEANIQLQNIIRVIRSLWDGKYSENFCIVLTKPSQFFTIEEGRFTHLFMRNILVPETITFEFQQDHLQRFKNELMNHFWARRSDVCC